jgi:hypothetical protein
MDILIQIWGGGLYLLNKIFFSVAEGRSTEVKRRLKIIGWTVYLAGVPAWIIIFVIKHNWIAAAIEAGGIPAMILGLLTVYYKEKRPHFLFDKFASYTIYISLFIGISYSLYDYGGITSVTQILEITTTLGFLIGSYMLAKNNLNGWLFFMLMNVSVAVLMFLQDKYLLTCQQMVSLSFVVYGFSSAKKISTQLK